MCPCLLLFLGPFATTLWKAFWVGFATGFTSAIIITGNFKTALKAGLIAGAIAGVGFSIKNSGAGSASSESGASGGVNDNISSNGFESSSAAPNVPTATDTGLSEIASQTGNSVGSNVGEALDRIVVTGTPIVAEFDAAFWFRNALASGSVAFLSDAADLVEFDAQSFPQDSLSRANLNQTAFNIRDVARQAQSVLDSNARTTALLSGAIITVATTFIPIGRAVGWAKGAVQNRFKKFLMKRQMLKVAATGRTGEAAVKAVYDIGAKPKPISIFGRNRIPDGLNEKLGTLSEVKNYSSKLSFTRQLKDFSAIAESRGLTFNLYVRSNTTFTAPLLKAINVDKTIIKIIIPGT